MGMVELVFCRIKSCFRIKNVLKKETINTREKLFGVIMVSFCLHYDLLCS